MYSFKKEFKPQLLQALVAVLEIIFLTSAGPLAPTASVSGTFMTAEGGTNSGMLALGMMSVSALVRLPQVTAKPLA